MIFNACENQVGKRDQLMIIKACIKIITMTQRIKLSMQWDQPRSLLRTRIKDTSLIRTLHAFVPANGEVYSTTSSSEIRTHIPLQSGHCMPVVPAT